MTIDDAGNVFVVWTQDNGSTDDIYAARYDAATGEWSPSQAIESTADKTDFPASRSTL